MKTRNKYYNPNPFKKETSDCVIRAMVKGTGKDWDTVYKELFEIGFELKVLPNDKECWEEYLRQNGFTYQKLSIKKGSKRPTVQSFCEKNKKGTFVLRVANHVVTAVDGFFYDLWDSGHMSMYGYWIKEEGDQ